MLLLDNCSSSRIVLAKVDNICAAWQLARSKQGVCGLCSQSRLALARPGHDGRASLSPQVAADLLQLIRSSNQVAAQACDVTPGPTTIVRRQAPTELEELEDCIDSLHGMLALVATRLHNKTTGLPSRRSQNANE